MDWKTFAVAMMVFSLIGILFLFILQLAQPVLPLNPAGIGSPSWDLALNTAVSFVTNTNWQAYAGESGVSYLTQMIGLCVQNFTSAATGLAVLAGLAYGLSRRSASTIGNFWILLVRSVMILLPISFIIALILVSQGTVQTLGRPGHRAASRPRDRMRMVRPSPPRPSRSGPLHPRLRSNSLV